MSKLDRLVECLRVANMPQPIAQDIIEALTAAKQMRKSVSLVRIIGKTIVEVRDEAAFVDAANEFSDLTD